MANYSLLNSPSVSKNKVEKKQIFHQNDGFNGLTLSEKKHRALISLETMEEYIRIRITTYRWSNVKKILAKISQNF